jgi:hypothetical protein
MELKSAASYSSLGGVVARGPIDHEHACIKMYCTALHCTAFLKHRRSKQGYDFTNTRYDTVEQPYRHRLNQALAAEAPRALSLRPMPMS